MNPSKEWVDAFETQTGRKPSPQEYMAGKNSQFDLSQIPRIAGLEESVKQTRSSSAPLENEDTRNLADVINQQYEATNLPEEEMTSTLSSPQSSPFPQAEPAVSSDAELESDSQVDQEADAASQDKVVSSEKKPSQFGLILGASAAAVLLGILGGGAVYMAQSTGPGATSHRFIQAVNAKNYEEVASMLTNYKSKWTAAEAESFVTYLNSQDVNFSDEMDKMAQSQGKNPYKDKNGNALLAMEEDGKKFGIFQEYRMTSFPLKVKMTSDIEQASVSVDDKTPVALNKSKETDVGSFHFIDQAMLLKGKTATGPVETTIKLDLKQAKNNELSMALNTKKVTYQLTMPNDIPNLGEVKVKINDKDSGYELTGELEGVPGQEVEIYLAFQSNGISFNTEKKKVTIPEDRDKLDLDMTLSKATSKKIQETEIARQKAEEARARAAEEARKKLEAQKGKIAGFLSEYRNAVFASIKGKNDSYAKYYDTSSQSYAEMNQFTTKGGAEDLKISYYTQGAMDIRSIDIQDGNFIVRTYEDFTVHYTNSNKTTTNRRNKTYYLRPNGDSFIIYQIDASDA